MDERHEHLIACIVRTFNLPEPLEKKVIWIAIRGVKNMCSTSFSRHYEYIAELVYKFQNHFQFFAPVSLDATFEDSDESLHHILGMEDPFFQRMFTDSEAEEVERGDGCVCDFEQSHDHTAIKLDSQNLQEVERLYQTLIGGGHLVPCLVRQNRLYRGCADPLEYFYLHQDKFKGLRRKELSRIDPGLCQSLRNYGQMNKAIPLRLTKRGGTPKRFFDGPLIYFLSHPKYWGMNRWLLHCKDKGLYDALLIEKQMDIAIPQKDLKTVGATESDVYHITESLRKHRGNIRKVAKDMEVTEWFINLHCSWVGILGLRVFSQPMHLTDEQISSILVAYFIYDANLSQAAQNLPHFKNTIEKLWKRARFDEVA